MQHRPSSKINPFKRPEAFLDLVKGIICSVAPYTGVFAVVFPAIAAPDDPSRSLRLTRDRSRVPKGISSHFPRIDDPKAADLLVDELVTSLVYNERADYDGDIVVSLYEARDRTPIAAEIGRRTIYVEFGSIRGNGYRLP
jgi:hypothetical protein